MDHETETRSSPNMLNKTIFQQQRRDSSSGYSTGQESFRSDSRSKSPGAFSISNVTSGGRQRESVEVSARNSRSSSYIPDSINMARNRNETVSEVSRGRSFSSSNCDNEGSNNKSFQKASCFLRGPLPLWLDATNDDDNHQSRGF